MSHGRRPDLLGQLHPTVLDFKRWPFFLRQDLQHLDRVRGSGANEAAILYCARILETLARVALETFKLPRVGEISIDLETLYSYSLLPRTTLYWAHALRRLGNDARHVRWPLTRRDTEAAVVLLERWLDWFFCRFSGRATLPALTHNGQPLEWGLNKAMSEAIIAMEVPNFAVQPLLGRLGLRRRDPSRQHEDCPPFLRVSALPAALAEILLDRDEGQAAFTVLDTALSWERRDPRLRQLMGLYHSRNNQFTEALSWLESLARDRRPDDETVGILAGVSKRQWKAEGKPELLQQCHEYYLEGWEDSGCRNPYLGINAATTALWLGRAGPAAQLARKVRSILQPRLDAVAAGPLVADYWNQAALAEALLVLGEVPAAQAAYRQAFTQHPEMVKAHQVSKDQALEILKALGRAGEASTFF